MKKKLTDYEAFSKNPFQSLLRGAIKHQWRRNDTESATPMVDNDSGEVVFLSPSERTKLLMKDQTEFTKVYLPAYVAMKQLSVPGIRLLAYLMTLLQKDKDWVRIDIGDAMDWMGYESRTNIYSGIVALLEAGFISRKTGHNGEYFINVAYMFNGKRTNLEYGRDLKDRLINQLKQGKVNLDSQTEENGEGDKA